MSCARWLPLLLIILFAAPTLGLKEEGATGIVDGPGAAFEVKAPPGWIFDDESCRPETGADVYPVGNSWHGDNGPVIHISVYFKHGRTLEEILAEQAHARKSESTHQDLPTLTTCEARQARVRAFGAVGDRVAHIDAPRVYCEIELSLPDRVGGNQGVAAFEEVVRSVRFLGPDSPEYRAHSEVERILVTTTEMQDILLYMGGGKKLKPSKPDVNIYRTAEGKGYGVVASYASKPTHGDPLIDYRVAWKELVQNGVGAGNAPVPESKTYGHWQVKIGLAEVEREGLESTVMLTVLSGMGKYYSILAIFNDRSFAPELDDFLFPRRLWGFWAAGDRGSRQYLDGELVHTGYSIRQYKFSGDEYVFRGELQLNPDHYVLLNERGTFSVNSNNLTFHSLGGTRLDVNADGGPISSQALEAWARTYTFRLVQIEEAIHGPYLVLTDVGENDIDGAHGKFFPNAFVYIRGYHPGVDPELRAPDFREFWRD